MNKEHIEDEVLALITEVEEGNEDALKAFIQLKGLADLIGKASDQIKESAIKEAKLEGEKSFEKFGAKIDIREGSARYDYKEIPKWVILSKKIKALEETAKHRAKNPSIIVADEDGEEIPPAKVTYTSETIAISLTKS